MTIVKSVLFTKTLLHYYAKENCELSKKGTGQAWILGSIVFLLSLNAVWALVELVMKGPQTEINLLYIIGLPVSIYFSASALLAMIFFSYLCSVFMRESRMDPTDKLIEDFEEKLKQDREQLGEAVTKTFARLSMNEFKIADGLKNIETHLKENQKRIEEAGEIESKYGKNVERQIFALKGIKTKIERIEGKLAPKPPLTSRSKIQEIGGVGQKIAEKLKSVGVTNVEELIIKDPAVIAQRIQLSKSRIEKIQTNAQLLMIPRISEKKVKLLQKAGITSIDQLASENSIQLFKKVVEATEDGDETPTLEEIASYIRFARSNFSVYH